MASLCGCGELARCRTSWTQNNPARRFLGCPNYMDPTRNCNFFRWVDVELPNRWYQARMYELHFNLTNAQNEIIQLNNHLALVEPIGANNSEVATPTSWKGRDLPGLSMCDGGLKPRGLVSPETMVVEEELLEEESWVNLEGALGAFGDLGCCGDGVF
ncbi:DNA-(apurinic or apyrimidinic site) lyase 2 [Tanacetum coccineum]